MRNFHGRNKKKSYFEGWYIKHQARGRTIAFIPAFHIDDRGEASASLQIVTESAAYNIQYPIEKFFAQDREFYVRIGGCVFHQTGCHIDLCDQGISVKGALTYEKFRPLSYDIMGPFYFVPGMECRHGVISMNHQICGTLVINGEKICFDRGSGYIETDRGHSFPKAYLWSQCNDFQGADCAVMISAADIPFGPGAFWGCISAICCRGKEYRLATYKGCRIDSLSANNLTLRQGPLILRATLLEDHPLELHAPVKGKMEERIYESAVCTVRYEFLDHNRTIFDLTSRQAGFEYMPGQKRR